MDTFDTYLSLILYFSFNKQTEDDHFKNLLIWSKSIMAFEYQINVFNKHNYYPQGLRDYNKERDRGTSAKITLMNYSDSWVQEKTGYPSNVLNYGLDRTGLHPTAKPLELIKYLIKTYTKEDDVVMDNCMGSNTTGLACKELNRQYIGIEKDKHYYDISVSRVRS